MEKQLDFYVKALTNIISKSCIVFFLGVFYTLSFHAQLNEVLY